MTYLAAMRASVAAAIDTLGCKAKNPKSRVKLVSIQRGARFWLTHVPKKRMPVFRKGHARTKTLEHILILSNQDVL